MSYSASEGNRLGQETSPYLQQHAANPVDWFPWGEEALQRARREDKPILLSIGYSACHWCHVMAHESFEDPTTAEVMNRHFINIKVDREERPDLDRIYQTAFQFLAQRPGGWPLTMLLTPEQVPFVGGTYFPPAPRHGLPGFRDFLERVAAFYQSHRDQVETQNASLLKALHQHTQGSEAEVAGMDARPLRQARSALAGSYDDKHGGFGGAPKFPHVGDLQFLLRRHSEDPEAAQMALSSLRAMTEGGLFDQLAGGFYRYSVDERWEIPHFEKMLYDNGPLLEALVDAWQVSGDRFFADAACRTAEWVMTEMQAPEGGYYATLDADSEGREGGFYLWSRTDFERLLEPEPRQVASLIYGLDRPANFEGEWHLNRRIGPEEAAERLGLPRDDIVAHLEAARRRLLAARATRTPPGRDDKVIAGWNGLMIRGMAEAGRRLREPRLLASAERALAFIRAHMIVDGRLVATWKDGRPGQPAFLDDHAFLIDGILSLLQARWRSEDLELAVELADALLEHFEDESRGGFFFTADDQEALIQRPKAFLDDSTPSGNGVAARVLLQLGRLTDRLEYLDAAERALRAGWHSLNGYPPGHGALLHALETYLTPATTVVLRGDHAALAPWREPLDTVYAPHRLILAIPNEATNLPDGLTGYAPESAPVAYVCIADRCLAPARTPEAFAQALAAQ